MTDVAIAFLTGVQVGVVLFFAFNTWLDRRYSEDFRELLGVDE